MHLPQDPPKRPEIMTRFIRSLFGDNPCAGKSKRSVLALCALFGYRNVCFDLFRRTVSRADPSEDRIILLWFDGAVCCSIQ